MAADVRKEQTFFFFLFLLGCSHLLPSHVDMMRTTHCQRFVIATSLDATAGPVPAEEAVFQVSLPPEKIHGLQTDSVMIAPPDEGCFPISGNQVCALKPAHRGFTWENKPKEKIVSNC